MHFHEKSSGSLTVGVPRSDSCGHRPTWRILTSAGAFLAFNAGVEIPLVWDAKLAQRLVFSWNATALFSFMVSKKKKKKVVSWNKTF